jgi:hypothetical protein
MNERELEKAFRSVASKLKGKPGCWEGEVEGIHLLVICDAAADRVRIIAPIHPVEPKDGEYLFALLSANFDRALDAKYAIFKDHLWATFLHDLSSLSPNFFHSSLQQVVTLVRNTPGTLASSDLVFGPAEDVESN